MVWQHVLPIRVSPKQSKIDAPNQFILTRLPGEHGLRQKDTNNLITSLKQNLNPKVVSAQYIRSLGHVGGLPLLGTLYNTL